MDDKVDSVLQVLPTLFGRRRSVEPAAPPTSPFVALLIDPLAVSEGTESFTTLCFCLQLHGFLFSAFCCPVCC